MKRMLVAAVLLCTSLTTTASGLTVEQRLKKLEQSQALDNASFTGQDKTNSTLREIVAKQSNRIDSLEIQNESLTLDIQKLTDELNNLRKERKRYAPN